MSRYRRSLPRSSRGAAAKSSHSAVSPTVLGRQNSPAPSHLGRVTLRKLGRAIAKRRRARNVSRQLLAKKVEISVESIRQIERGLHDIDVVLLAKIAQALNSAMSQLVVSPRGPFRRQQ